MNKTEYVLLMLLLTLAIVFVGGAEEKQTPEPTTLFDQDNSAISNINYSGTSLNQTETVKLPAQRPVIPNTLITNLLPDHIQKPCWIRLCDTQRQVFSIARSGYITQNTIVSYKSVQHDGQYILVTPSSFSKSLHANSPPGLIQRL